MLIKLVERHIIDNKHQLYEEIDGLAFKSKNLYNYANYIIRQEYIFNKKYLNYNAIEKIVKDSDDYKALPAKISQQILMVLDRNWRSFFKAMQAYKINPQKFKARPKLPKYKDKKSGRNILIYTKQAISKPKLEEGIISLSQSNIEIRTKQTNIKQVRIVPRINDYYVIEVVYKKEERDLKLDKKNEIGIDIGLDNLGTVTSNKKGFRPIIINGRPLKSINVYYNKKKAQLQSNVGEKGQSRRIKKLTFKRDKKINNYLHNASRFIIDLCIENDIGTIVIGKNGQWKQEINLGKVNNQKFVYIPHSRFIEQIRYKATLVGIEVILTEESYTSKASFLDLDKIPNYKDKKQRKEPKFSGRRILRGLYRSKRGKLINADVNGSYNIIRKVFLNAFRGNRIKGVVVHPIRVTPYKLALWNKCP